jgi:hypothetical protein
MTRSSRAARRVLGPGLVIWIVATCTTAGGSPDPSGSPRQSTVVVTPALPTPSPAPSSAAPAVSGDRPPDAHLAAEGGDPVAGQLGSYIWADGGSDSPWLPGARVTVGAGEPLTITLDPPVAVASWRARSVPSTADGPDGAVVLGEGVGVPAFAAPGAGVWTIEVHVIFVDGAGDASYFWSAEVR